MVATRGIVITLFVLLLRFCVSAAEILPITSNGKVGWFSTTGAIHATDTYYAHVVGLNGMCGITTVDRLTLGVVFHVWPGRNVIPLNASQTRAVLVSNDNTSTMLSIVDSKLTATSTWVIPASVEVYPGLGDNIILKPPKHSLKEGVWILSLKNSTLHKLDGADYNNSFISKDDFTLEYGKLKVVLYNRGKKLWENTSYDISSAILADDGASIVVQRTLEDNIASDTDDGFGNGKYVFRCFSPTGNVAELGTFPMSGKVIAISPKGIYTIIGNQSNLQVVNTQNGIVLWKRSFEPLSALVSQAVILDNGNSLIWQIGWNQPKGHPKEPVTSKLLHLDEKGMLQREYDIWPNLPGKPLPYLSLYQENGVIDIINSLGVVNRFAIDKGGVK